MNTKALASPRKPRTLRHHAVRWSLGLIALLLITFVVIAATVFYLIKTVDGQRTLFGAVQSWSNGLVTVVEPAGDIRGNFSAKEVQIALASSSIVVRNLSYSLADYDLRPARFHFDRLSAAEVDVSTRPSEPSLPPKSLDLPFALAIDALTVGKLSVRPEKSDAAKATVITDMSGSVNLDPKAHVVKLGSATVNTLRITGDATLAAQAPLALKASVFARQEAKGEAAGIPWTATIIADGPLENFDVKLTASASDQSLDATARVQPFATMPLSALVARFDRFDVSKLLPNAPSTTLTGKADIALVKDQPMRIVVEATNVTPGPLDRKLLPISALKIIASGTPQNAVIEAFNGQLSGSKGSAGRIVGSGTWKTGPWQLAFDASDVKLAELDTRWPALQVAGRVIAAGVDTTATKPIALKATLKGTALAALIDQNRLPTGLRSGVDVSLTGKIQQSRIELSELNVVAGAAQVRGKLLAERDAALKANEANAAQGKLRPWRVTTDTLWSQLDPFAFMPPRTGAKQSAMLNGSIKGNAVIDPAALTQPINASATLVIKDSRWGMQPLTGEAKLALLGPAIAPRLPPRIETSGSLVLASTRAQWSGRLGAASDVLTWSLDAQNLSALQAVSQTQAKGDEANKATLRGVIKAQGSLSGAWNALAVDASVSGQDVARAEARIQKFVAKLQVALQPDAPFNLDLRADGISSGAQTNTSISSLNLQGKGSLREHRIEATSTMKQGERILQLSAALAGRSESSATSALAAWAGAIERLQVTETATREGATQQMWARVEPFTLRWKSGTETSGSTFAADAGKALIATVPIDWSALQYTAARGAAAAPKFSGTGNIGPFNVVTLERELGRKTLEGDLVLAGRFAVSTDNANNGLRAMLELSRQSGDLRIGDNAGSSLLGLRELKFAMNAEQGIWRVSQIIDGDRVGRAEATANITASAQDLLPPMSSPLDGKLTARLDNLAAWGSFLPPGWRLGGGLNGEAKFSGTLGTPKGQGALVLNDLSIKNPLEGVDLIEGRGRIVFVGDQVQLEAVSARGGDGRITVDGKGTLSTKPDVQLTLKAENFRLLGRVDRRVDASGTARLSANFEAIKLDGSFKVDRGFVDISQADAPALSDDVIVKRKPTAAEMQAVSTAPPRKTKIDVNLALDLGGDLQLKGRGIDTRLAGQLKLTTPGGQIAANGNVRTVRGTYRAYGQDLEIDRGQIAFTGNLSNPRLDILALRARSDPDQTVGVAITGTALSPRIKLYADPERADTEKLAMLVTGKSADNLSRDDTALVQKAAFALLAGEGESLSSKFGLDTLGVATNSGTTKDTVVTVGKQISDRLYVGYERGLKATTGTLQLIYRINSSLNIRAQSGEESAIDLFWTLRWDRSPFDASERRSRQ